MDKLYRFSIIVTDYDLWVDRERARKGLQSIQQQTFRDFEVLLIHDGPRTRDVEKDLEISKLTVDYTIVDTPARENKWGHPQRNMGIHMARGEYVIHFNIDNYLEPSALEIVNSYLERDPLEGYIFPIRQHVGDRVSILPGYPPVHCGIDCLQMCASIEAWRSIGGWYNYEESSDGRLYEELYQKFRIGRIFEILGDNYISPRS